MHRLLTRLVALVALALILSSPSQAMAEKAVWLGAGDVIPTPAAFLSFCARNPADCQHGPQIDEATFQARLRERLLDRLGIGSFQDSVPAGLRPDDRFALASTSQPSRPVLSRDLAPDIYNRFDMTPDLWKTVRQINAKVNRTLRARSDLSQFGREDYWFVPKLDGDAYGDCEDYVLLKRRMLIESGFAPESLSIAIAETRRGEVHAVLVLTTDTGDFILDNLRHDIRPWHKVKYNWISRQSATDPLLWRALTI